MLMSKWHVLRGRMYGRRLDATQAPWKTQASLDRSHAVAGDAGEGRSNYTEAVDVPDSCITGTASENPNDRSPGAEGDLHAFRDEGKKRATTRIPRLSPSTRCASIRCSWHHVALSAGQYQRALQLAERSYRLNRTHTSTLRSIITALWSLGREVEARSVTIELLKLDPTYCIQKFLERSPAAPYQFGRTVVAALEAGVYDEAITLRGHRAISRHEGTRHRGYRGYRGHRGTEGTEGTEA